MTKKNNRKNTQRAQKRVEKNRKRNQGKKGAKQNFQSDAPQGDSEDRFDKRVNELAPLFENFCPNPFSTHDWRAPIYVRGTTEKWMVDQLCENAPMPSNPNAQHVVFDMFSGENPVKRLFEIGAGFDSGLYPLDMCPYIFDVSKENLEGMCFFWHEGTLDSVWMKLAEILEEVLLGTRHYDPMLTGKDWFVAAAYQADVTELLPEEFVAPSLLKLLNHYGKFETPEDELDDDPVDVLIRHGIMKREYPKSA